MQALEKVQEEWAAKQAHYLIRRPRDLKTSELKLAGRRGQTSVSTKAYPDRLGFVKIFLATMTSSRKNSSELATTFTHSRQVRSFSM